MNLQWVRFLLLFKYDMAISETSLNIYIKIYCFDLVVDFGILQGYFAPVVVKYASYHQEKVKKLILVNPPVRFSKHLDTLSFWFICPFVLPTSTHSFHVLPMSLVISAKIVACLIESSEAFIRSSSDLKCKKFD